MHRKYSVVCFVLVLFLPVIFSGMAAAQNNPFGQNTTVTNTQSSNSPFAVSDSQRTANQVGLEINGDWVNVRTGPGTDNSVLKTLPRGKAGIRINGKDGWSQIDFGDGLIGWVKDTLLTRTATATQAPVANSTLGAANDKQFSRWNKHLGADILDFNRFPWFWRLNRAQKSFENGDYQKALELARGSSGNPLEAAFMQAQCLNKMGEHQKAANMLKAMEKNLEDIVFTRKLEQIVEPYINEPIVFKFGGFDDIETYKKKKAAGNPIGLESSVYYDKYVDISTWKWRSDAAYKEFQKIGGIDCSGFVQIIQKDAFADAGVKFPITAGRTSTSGLWSQKFSTPVNPGVTPPPPPDIRPGDMILLDYGHNRYGHSMIYKGTDRQGNIIVMQMGGTAETSILPAHKFEFYKGTYRMNGMDQVRKALTA